MSEVQYYNLINDFSNKTSIFETEVIESLFNTYFSVLLSDYDQLCDAINNNDTIKINNIKHKMKGSTQLINISEIYNFITLDQEKLSKNLIEFGLTIKEYHEGLKSYFKVKKTTT
ncbi:hypothetical protein [Shewanella japonica]|uniref:HPt domain-containing protein n=1 Tax=Shewanella japonica TaxID=93973 RepID=A0ABN4YDI0_9GAMM|nr:hypothetical protein [Shewanella japonica]ARD22486.1 hypothetical protein SJ2017_2193 [Shewanella japonica]